MPPPSSATLFPYTTLFRSRRQAGGRNQGSLGLDGSGVGYFAALRRSSHDTLGRRFGDAAADGDRSEGRYRDRSEEHTSELQSHVNLVCRLLLEKKKRPHPQ